jgi:hypothetical protein
LEKTARQLLSSNKQKLKKQNCVLLMWPMTVSFTLLAYYKELSIQIKKRVNFKDKHLQFASMFCPASIKTKNNFSFAYFINLFPQISCDIEAADFEFQNLLDMDLSTFMMNFGKKFCL